jgi:hypothetical protein
MYNAWYYAGLEATIKSAKVIGVPDDAPEVVEMKRRLKSIKGCMETVFWKPEEKAYRSMEAKAVDDRANGLAVWVGLVPESHYVDVKNVLTSVKNSSPYMERCILEGCI